MSADRKAKLKKFKEDRAIKLKNIKEKNKSQPSPGLMGAAPGKYIKKSMGGKVMKRAGGGTLTGNQKKLDADGSGTITANDFQKLRNRDKMVSKKYGGRMMKRAGGGMTYQLYGGSSKNIHDGNTEISQFYDTKK